MVQLLYTLFFTVFCRFSQNFGVFGILDRLHNTDDVFRHSKAHKRNIIHFGLTPLRELIPDSKAR